MNCKSTREMLSAYLDRELGTQERDAVRGHLADCDRCRCEERELRALKGLLLGVRAPEPADDFEHRLMARLRAESAGPVRPSFAFPKLRPLTWGPVVGLAACAALGTFVMAHSPETVVVQAPPLHAHSSVVQSDYNDDADRYEAYSRADDFVPDSSLFMPTAYAR